MTYIRHYILEAAGEDAGELRRALAMVRDAVAPMPGCLGVELLIPDGAPRSVHLVERWASEADHATALASVPPEAMAAMQAAVGGRPTAFSLRPLGED